MTARLVILHSSYPPHTTSTMSLLSRFPSLARKLHPLASRTGVFAAGPCLCTALAVPRFKLEPTPQTQWRTHPASLRVRAGSDAHAHCPTHTPHTRRVRVCAGMSPRTTVCFACTRLVSCLPACGAAGKQRCKHALGGLLGSPSLGGGGWMIRSKPDPGRVFVF